MIISIVNIYGNYICQIVSQEEKTWNNLRNKLVFIVCTK